MLDISPELSICPETSRTFPGHPGMIIAAVDGTPLRPTLRLTGADVGGQGDHKDISLNYADQT